MKQIRKQDDILKALELCQLDARIKQDSKRAQELRDYFKNKIKDGYAKAGSVEFAIKSIERESVDKRLLVATLGAKAKKFISKITYKTMTIKKVA